MAEQLPLKQFVEGSSPPGVTMKTKKILKKEDFFVFVLGSTLQYYNGEIYFTFKLTTPLKAMAHHLPGSYSIQTLFD